MSPFRKARIGFGAFALVLAAGTLGYALFGATPLDAFYDAVVTVATVGFTPHRPSDGEKVFTILLILVGAGTALYTFSAMFELLVEGHMRDLVRRRKVERSIEELSGHVIVCGLGRVGREVTRFLNRAGWAVVVVDRNAERTAGVPELSVVGNATDDAVLQRAGIGRAAALVAALDTDADNLYLVVSGKSMRSDLQVIARARDESSAAKLQRAGADRVVNPQQLGGDRMASFVTQPHVVDFVDVVMHDGSLEFRLEEQPVPPASPLAGATLRSAQLRERTGALVLAIRRVDGGFVANPAPEQEMEPGDVLISVGTAEQLRALAAFASSAPGG